MKINVMCTRFFFMLMVALGISLAGHSQHFNKTMSRQKAAIQSAYKKKKITQREYQKLMDEQHEISVTIRKYNSDGYLTGPEKNKVAAKQQRAADRLRKYQTNSERY